jgi:hypothetical protein
VCQYPGGIFESFGTTRAFLSIETFSRGVYIKQMQNDVVFKLTVIAVGMIPVALFLLHIFAR